MKAVIKNLGRFAGIACIALTAACDGNYAAAPDVENSPTGPVSNPNRLEESVFGDGGLSVSSIRSGELFGLGPEEGGGSLPVNKFLWQASLQTLDFMPLVSTDPFTGVIATDWSTPPGAAGERVKVTVYVVNPQLAASALKVAVFREVRTEEGLWQPAPVNPDTPRQLEDAILTKARQIKIAELEGSSTG